MTNCLNLWCSCDSCPIWTKWAYSRYFANAYGFSCLNMHQHAKKTIHLHIAITLLRFLKILGKFRGAWRTTLLRKLIMWGNSWNSRYYPVLTSSWSSSRAASLADTLLRLHVFKTFLNINIKWHNLSRGLRLLWHIASLARHKLLVFLLLKLPQKFSCSCVLLLLRKPLSFDHAQIRLVV